MKDRNKMVRVYGSKILYCQILDCIYEATLVDPTEESFCHWKSSKDEIIRRLAQGHGIEEKVLRGALEAKDGVRGQLWGGHKANTKKIINELLKSQREQGEK